MLAQQTYNLVFAFRQRFSTYSNNDIIIKSITTNRISSWSCIKSLININKSERTEFHMGTNLTVKCSSAHRCLCNIVHLCIIATVLSVHLQTNVTMKGSFNYSDICKSDKLCRMWSVWMFIWYWMVFALCTMHHRYMNIYLYVISLVYTCYDKRTDKQSHVQTKPH